jgi:hypothetical protein
MNQGTIVSYIRVMKTANMQLALIFPCSASIIHKLKLLCSIGSEIFRIIADVFGVTIEMCRKVKQSHYRPGQALFQVVEVPRFQDIWHMKVVRLSALCTSHLYPQETFLVLISVRS